MGGFFSSLSTSQEYSSSECSSDSEFEYSDSDMDMDAVEATINFTLDDVVDIYKMLDPDEKVALVYLLYEQPTIALQYIMQILRHANVDVLTEWAKFQKDGERFTKSVMYNRFLPLTANTSLYVNGTRKCLYRVCEDMNNIQTTNFISRLKRELSRENIKTDFTEYKNSHLEMYFLYLETENYITLTNVNRVAQIFKSMELDSAYDVVSFLCKNNPGTLRKSDPSSERHITPTLIESNESAASEMIDINCDKTPSSLTIGVQQVTTVKADKNEPNKSLPLKLLNNTPHQYYINPENPGTLLIINNKDFYTNLNKEYRHLTPRSNQKLETREGTETDENNLKFTFEAFGYKVKIENNLKHDKMREKIKSEVNKIDTESSLIIAILSHGEKGIIYGSDSVLLKVDEIKSLMCETNPKLVGKPKVLLLQSCQGSAIQEICGDDDIEADGPISPKTKDLLVFWATIPGYGAFRHKRNGSWFIQSLCNKINDRNMSHFMDICTYTLQDVTEKKWNTEGRSRVMVPLIESTLSKLFYLPQRQSIGVNYMGDEI